ncbi:MAG: amidohydrolase, partial [Solirubrobacterales bacterium]|nr:amidohydrolase [Solirubrobacterales bacterium]
MDAVHTSDGSPQVADTIVLNGRIATLAPARPSASAAAMGGGRFLAVGDDAAALRHRGPGTQIIDLGGRTAIPGLNDSHIHVIRGGLSYALELRWEGVPSLADALHLLKEQAARTPAPQWVRVVGGWTEFQFAERRLPTLDELNEAAPETPVFILNLYAKALLNRAALRAVGYTRDTPSPPRGEIQKDAWGNPTGLLIAEPDPALLYTTLGNGPRLGHDEQLISTRHFMRELNRLGLTSVVDAGGGHQAYPADYAVIEELHRADQLTLRFAYNLFTQKPGQEADDWQHWIDMLSPGQGDDFYRLNGVGEMILYSAYDFENFQQPRPLIPLDVDAGLKDAITLFVANRWPFRLHATYDESIGRFLDIFEAVDRDVPFAGLHCFFDHAETISARNLERTKALGGGIAIQHRMAFQGEYFVNRYGASKAEATPPVAEMLRMGLPVSAGTDATRVASYNPWVCLYWLTTGKTVGGFGLYPGSNRLSREQALRLYTQAGPWFSSEDGQKGAIQPGQLADLAVLSDDYFAVDAERIKGIESVLTVVDGKVVY